MFYFFLYQVYYDTYTHTNAKTSFIHLFIRCNRYRKSVDVLILGREGIWREEDSLAGINEDHNSVHNCVLRNAAHTYKKTSTSEYRRLSRSRVYLVAPILTWRWARPFSLFFQHARACRCMYVCRKTPRYMDSTMAPQRLNSTFI